MLYRALADLVVIVHLGFVLFVVLGGRRLGGEAGYPGDFVEHYLLPVLYPAALTRTVQYVLAGVVLAVSLAAYGWVLALGRRAV